MNARKLLDMFRESGMHFTVIDEHGGVEDVITMNVVPEEISGDFIADQPRLVRRDANSWLVDCFMAMAAFTVTVWGGKDGAMSPANLTRSVATCSFVSIG